ncbi:MAG: hypothetical protein EBZ59_07280 [Planctomycetia bacterium]|nr:hypothetical protein [Planctomycetia bacterium]
MTDCQLGGLDMPASPEDVRADPPAQEQQSAIGDSSTPPRSRRLICVDGSGTYRLRLHAGAADIPAGDVPGREWIG